MEKTSENEVKLKLNIMVDSKAEKVVFAEAGKDFVDFLFHMLSLPLATVGKLLKGNEEMAGSLPKLYESVESLSQEYFEHNVNKDSVLLPKLPIVLPLLSLDYYPISLTLFKCPDHNRISDHEGPECCTANPFPRYCFKPLKQVTFSYAEPSSNFQLPGFVKGPVRYMVLDNLEVKPMSMALIKYHVNDFDVIVEKEVDFGLKEALALLRASLETDNVLTTVFLRNKK